MNQRDAYLDALALLGPFRACSRDQLRAIGRSTTMVTRPAGSVLVRQGASTKEVVIIAAGVAIATRDDQPDAVLRDGDCFGDADLLAGNDASATLVALTDIDLVVMSPREFSAMLEKVPTFRRRVVTSLAERAISTRLR